MNTQANRAGPGADILRKGDAVRGRYMGVEFTGSVRSARLNERSRNIEVEIDFPAPLAGFRGRDWDVRTGVILTNLGDGDFVVRA